MELTHIEFMRSAAYGKLAKGGEVDGVLTTLATYAAEMEAYYEGRPVTERNDWAIDRLALRVLYAEIARIGRGGHPDASEPVEVTPAPVATGSLPNGTYTIAFTDGSHRTIRLVEDWRDDAPDGSQVAQLLTGPDNTNDFAGVAFVMGREARVWKRFKDAVELRAALDVLMACDLEGAKELGEAYALVSGRCWRCNRTLTTPESIRNGIGPECARKLAA